MYETMASLSCFIKENFKPAYYPVYNSYKKKSKKLARKTLFMNVSRTFSNLSPQQRISLYDNIFDIFIDINQFPGTRYCFISSNCEITLWYCFEKSVWMALTRASISSIYSSISSIIG